MTKWSRKIFFGFLLGVLWLSSLSFVDAGGKNLYQNEKYGYELKVLPGWTIKEKSAEDVMLFSLSEVCSIWVSVISIERSDSYGDFLLDQVKEEDGIGISKTVNQSILTNFPDYQIEYTKLSTDRIVGHRVIETMFFPKDESGDKSPILVTGVVRKDQMFLLLSKAENVTGMNRDLDEVVTMTKSFEFMEEK